MFTDELDSLRHLLPLHPYPFDTLHLLKIEALMTETWNGSFYMSLMKSRAGVYSDSPASSHFQA